jgi:DnaJ-like protein
MDVAVASATLGVGSHFSQAELRHAYKQRLRLVHPDAGGTANPAAIKQVKQAYHQLAAQADIVPPAAPAVPLTYGRLRPEPARFVDCYA